MTYKDFTNIPVWQDAILLAEGVDDLIRTIENKILSFSKKDQIERASLSVSNNIAEGFERGSTNDLIKFLYIARGSAAETRSMLIFLSRRPYLKQQHAQIQTLNDLALSCCKQIRGWTKHLQNTEIKGPRHLKD